MRKPAAERRQTVAPGVSLVFTHKSAFGISTLPSHANDVPPENTLSREGRW